MRRNERLAEEQRLSRRTVADAIEVLRGHTDFNESDHAKVVAFPLVELSPGNVSCLVDIHFDVADEDTTFMVSLPTSARFLGIRAGYSSRQKFEISRLDGAIIDATAQVLLTDGTKMRAVEVKPCRRADMPSRGSFVRQ